ELRRGSGGACRLDYFRVSPDNGSAIGYEIFDQACAGTLVFDQKRCPAVLLAKPRYGTPELGIVDALAPQIEQVAVVTAGEPDRSNGIVGQLRAFHRGIETDDQKIVIPISWSDLVFLEPLGLDDVAGKGNRLLLILRRKEQFGHLPFQALKVFQRFTSWIDHGAGFSPINASRADRNRLVLLCNGRDLEVMPSALFEQAASQIVFMQALHDDHDRAVGLRIEAREKGGIEPLASAGAMRFR